MAIMKETDWSMFVALRRTYKKLEELKQGLFCYDAWNAIDIAQQMIVKAIFTEKEE